MNSPLTFLSQLSQIAKRNDHRFGVVVRGHRQWQHSLLQQYISSLPNPSVFQVGGTPISADINAVPMKKGHGLLGRECDVLVCDFTSGFDANGFTAAVGALVGGGLLLIIPPAYSNEVESVMGEWLEARISQLITLHQEKPLPLLPDDVSTKNSVDGRFHQQREAVALIHKVLKGHRKRPLIITADRGRGKSSALGIASAEIMAEKPLTIFITAPSPKAVQPVFEHAEQLMKGAERVSATCIRHNGGELRFVAPDEILTLRGECDLLLVDEAAAIPLPMLKRIVEHYHRVVFSTTVHGYEGSGRGFGLKFQAWLSQHRPGWKLSQIEQPIRWAEEDPLEQWLFDAFLLNAEAAELGEIHPISAARLRWELIDKAQAVASPNKLIQCFALLVEAHYQTSPNDLMQLLDDPKLRLFGLFQDNVCIGCVLTVDEGQLDAELVSAIQNGKRRPRGQLAPAILANHLGINEAAQQRCLRVMRIAVHPDAQRCGYGHDMLTRLKEDALGHYDYLATSFGATSDLVSFWQNNKFNLSHIGSQRDQSSGCHALLMVQPLSDASKLWASGLQLNFSACLGYLFSSTLRELEPDMVRILCRYFPLKEKGTLNVSLILNYINGGNGFDSVAYLIELLIVSLSNDELDNVSDLMIRKVIQKWSWAKCVSNLALVGRKQAEAQLRADVSILMKDLHCK